MDRTLAFAALGICAVQGADFRPSLKITGQAFTEAARIMRSSDTLVMNYQGNVFQSMTGQLTATVDLGKHVEAALGLGMYQYYHSQGDRQVERFQLGTFKNFVTQARATAYLGDKQAPWLDFTVGNFVYNYHPAVKDLGLYLLRGSVYPGFLASGFQDHRTDTTRAGVMGARLHHAMGDFQHDLILMEERDLPPSFDISLAYVARYKAFGALELGAGVNFYRLIPNEGGLTTPSRGEFPTLYQSDSLVMASAAGYHPYELQYIEVRGPGDTVFYTHRGTKVMAMFTLDLKPLFGTSGMGPKDLVLYGEAAIIGVKDYGSVYDDIRERIPVMAGINVPTFGLLDHLSLEVEWYGARYRADYSKLGIYNSPYLRGINPPGVLTGAPSPIPVGYADFDIGPDGTLIMQSGDTLRVKGTGMDLQDLTRDDLKWSVNVEKVLHRHIRFTGQIANDHFIPRPARTGIVAEDAGFREAFTDPRDWYFMFRLGFFF